MPSLDTECGRSFGLTFLANFDEILLGVFSPAWEWDGGTGEGDAAEHATESEERDRPNPPMNFNPEVPLVGEVAGAVWVGSALRRGQGVEPPTFAISVVAGPLEACTGFDGVLCELLV